MTVTRDYSCSGSILELTACWMGGTVARFDLLGSTALTLVAAPLL